MDTSRNSNSPAVSGCRALTMSDFGLLYVSNECCPLNKAGVLSGWDGENAVLLSTLMDEQTLHRFTLRTEGGIVLKKLPVGYHVSDEIFVVDGSKDNRFRNLIGALMFYQMRLF